MARRSAQCLFFTVFAVAWLTLSPESHALVEILPDVSLTVDGRAIQDHRAVVSYPALREILAAFGRAEAAVQKQDLDQVLQFYAKAYNYHGLKPTDVRRIWDEVFTHYHNLSSTHLFSVVKVFRSGSQLRAEITCTGGLYGTESQGGARITLDSWFQEVHYLVHEDGAWRFLGNAGVAPSAEPFTSSPHHPLF
ncbi:MAG: hypothetical protein NT179_09235 [Nitrospirae bacterium]|nr:hypothetical protein [Nitrospirota bacterium]